MTTDKQTEPSQNNDISLFKEIVDHAHSEIAWVRGAYRFAVSIVGTLIAIGIFFSYSSVRDLKQDMRTDADRMSSQLSSSLAAMESTIQQELQRQVGSVRVAVSERIDKEFGDKAIASMVEDKARARIDEIADSLIGKQIKDRIEPLRTELVSLISSVTESNAVVAGQLQSEITNAETAGKELNTLLADTRALADRLNAQSEFMMNVFAAQTDNRTAFDKLGVWASDPSNPLRAEAIKARSMITRSYVGWLGEKPFLRIPWETNAQPDSFTQEQLTDAWQVMPAELAPGFVTFVWDHTNATKEFKMDFMHRVLADSKNSLQAADIAARKLAGEAKVDYSSMPFNFGKIEDWWPQRTNEVIATE